MLTLQEIPKSAKRYLNLLLSSDLFQKLISSNSSTSLPYGFFFPEGNMLVIDDACFLPAKVPTSAFLFLIGFDLEMRVNREVVCISSILWKRKMNHDTQLLIDRNSKR